MADFARGLYETLLTELLDKRLAELPTGAEPDVVDLRDAEAADRVALHLARVIRQAIEALPEKGRAESGAGLARRVIEQLTNELSEDALVERPALPARTLRSIRGRAPDGSPEIIQSPLIPLLDTTLLTNAPGEPRVGQQIKTEIASADRIDVVMAFIRRTGIRPLIEGLRRHVEAGRSLRVLTTTYTGSTEAEALDELKKLGAQVRVSYDTTGTRLHAKAWLFHRESGFSTAYVGSSNLTNSAQVTGLEWNVRVSGTRNADVIEKIAAVFESYWQQADFEDYDRERFLAATEPRERTDDVMSLSPIEIRLEPFQERLLEQIALSRQQGQHRNLLVSATGTGKTVMAAVDYARLKSEMPRARLLFVAHREEILEQSRATFRHALRDASFGEMWVRGARPRYFDHVFASIQSLSRADMDALEPGHFDVVIVDEFHHAAAASYERLLMRLQPVELLALTATPERSDGLPILHWFDNRIAAELRLWDAIDQHRLVPFSYFGVADNVDLRDIPWKRGTGYDVEGLTKVLTASDAWARSVIHQFRDKVGTPSGTRAIGFCVGVEHARYMARVFNENGIKAVAVWGDTAEDERRQALADLAAARTNIIFAVDLFNEGIDIPAVDSLLMLRPTDSPVLFLQQLGRGLRKAPNKNLCTVVDFVGQHRKEFRYHRRLQALLGGSRSQVAKQVAEGFPFLPAGCSMELDPVATERVLDNLRYSLPSRWNEKVAELRSLAQENPGITLSAFLNESGLELADIYDGKTRSWSALKEAASLPVPAKGPDEDLIRRAIGRLDHIDDHGRLDSWRAWLRDPSPPDVDTLVLRQRRLLRMLLVQLRDGDDDAKMTLQEGAARLWAHPQARAELVELFDVLAERVEHVAIPLVELPDVPLVVHGRYTRLEMLAALSNDDLVKVRTWREGTLFDSTSDADLFAFTLDKTSGAFSPTTRYRDYAISRELIHWESQSGTSADSPTGRRYQNHASTGSHVLMSARVRADERAFWFLGPATYVTHVGERPMAITWKLRHVLPGDLFQLFAAAVA